MTQKLGLAALAALALAGCEQERGVGFGPIGGDGPEVPAAEVIDLSLPGVRPIPLYAVATGTGPEAAVAYGGGTLSMPQSNLDLTIDGQTYLLRQVAVGRENYVVVEGAVAPAAQIPVEIRRRTGCLLTGVPTIVRRAAGGPGVVVYRLDCS